MRKHRWKKRLTLALLALAGAAIVSVPVTVAAGLAAAGEEDAPLIISTDTTPDQGDANPSEAVARAQACKPTRGYYALTFDDGPYPGTTARLVRALRDAGAVATFFDVGERAAARPDLVRLQRTVGQVANHSYTHQRLPGLSSERRLSELTATARTLGYPNAWVRPPFGETDAATDADIATTGLTPVYWTTDTYDWQRPAPETIVRRAATVDPGGIILLHDGRPNTVEAVPAMVAELRKRGMCPGFLAKTGDTVLSAYRGTPFHVEAVAPGEKRAGERS